MNNIITSIPRYAFIKKGEWVEYGYGGVWCKIREIDLDGNSQLALNHPKFGEFAWVSIYDCKFAFKKPK